MEGGGGGSRPPQKKRLRCPHTLKPAGMAPQLDPKGPTNRHAFWGSA